MELELAAGLRENLDNRITDSGELPLAGLAARQAASLGDNRLVTPAQLLQVVRQRVV